ncbi:hypothetical protein F4808DRAFT_431326 [Astrocystis sublimbata]|nr:hypothetical protein F4808DRAFT_431326 [Astrocystis sublimbata]
MCPLVCLILSIYSALLIILGSDEAPLHDTSNCPPSRMPLVVDNPLAWGPKIRGNYDRFHLNQQVCLTSPTGLCGTLIKHRPGCREIELRNTRTYTYTPSSQRPPNSAKHQFPIVGIFCATFPCSTYVLSPTTDDQELENKTRLGTYPC